MKKNILNDFDEYDKKWGLKIRKDFTLEIDTFEQALFVLSTCINKNILGKPEIMKELNATDYRKINPSTVGFFVCGLLLSEALIRLLAARRLFLSGYISRALACTRDALESAMVADVCRNNLELSKKWISGKQIILTNKLKYDKALSWEVWRNAQAMLNPLGTHSYLQAVSLSSTPQHVMFFPENDEAQRRYLHDTKFVLWRMLIRCWQILMFIKHKYPDAKANINNFDKILSTIQKVTEDELQITLDEELIKQNTTNMHEIIKKIASDK